MGRIPRSALPDGFFHVYARGIDGLEVFPTGSDRSDFLTDVRACERLHGWVCHAVVVLGTHYHLVLETSRKSLSAGLHRLNGAHARRFNRRYGRHGHVFSERFQARVIEDETYLFDVCSYVVLNPVRAGLCDRPDDWPWSYSRYGG